MFKIEGADIPSLIEQGKTEVEKLSDGILKMVVGIDFEDLEKLHSEGHDPMVIRTMVEELLGAMHDTHILQRTEKLEYVEYHRVRLGMRKLLAQTPNSAQAEGEMAMAI